MNILSERLFDLRRRARRVVWTQGVSLLAVVLIGTVLFIGISDWFAHHTEWSLIRFLGQPFDDPGVRLMLSLGILLAVGFIAWVSLLRPLSFKLFDLDLALRVEAHHPGFKDSLASTVQFLESPNDPRVGSVALQNRVIERTLQQVAGLDFRDIVDTRRVRLFSALATGVCLVAALVVGINRDATSIALQRLLFPLAKVEWPPRVTLQLLTTELQPIEVIVDVETVEVDGKKVQKKLIHKAEGDSLQFYVRNTSGSIPNDIRLVSVAVGGKLQTEPLKLTSARDEQGNLHEVAVGQLQAGRRPIKFRVQGGDDLGMLDYELVSVPPPMIESLQVTVEPPAYTKRKPYQLPAGVGQVEDLVGSTIKFDIQISKPVKDTAAIKLKDQKPRKVTLADDRQSLTAVFTIEQPGLDSWWLDMQDDGGFQNVDAPRYEIRGIPDQIPDVMLELPATDLVVTIDAEIDVKAIVRDDLGIKEVRIAPASQGSNLIPVDQPPSFTPIVVYSGSDRPRQHTVDKTAESKNPWKLAELNKQPGDEVLFHVEATDDCTVGPPHLGFSTARRLTFVTKEQKTKDLAERQAGLLDELERAFKLQDQAHTQVKELNQQLEKTGKLRPQDVDSLQRVELTQRQLTRQLADPTDGLERQARDILSELEANKLTDEETENRVTQIAKEIRRLADKNLPAIENELTTLRKLSQEESPPAEGGANKPTGKEPTPKAPPAQTPSDKGPTPDTTADKPNNPQPGSDKPQTDKPKPDMSKPAAASAANQTADTEQSLNRVSADQQEVLESLGDLLQQLAQWRSERDALRDVGEIIDEQKQIQQEGAELAKQTVDKPSDQLTEQEQADLAKLAERQRKQADRLEQLETRLEDTARRMNEKDPGSAESLKDAAEFSREQSVAQKMRDAAGSLENNEPGKASPSQQESIDKLREMDDILRNRRESNTEELVKKMKQAEEELQKVEQQQEELIKKTQEAEKIADPQQKDEELQKIQAQQQELQEELERLARRMQRLHAEDAAAAADRAAERLERAKQKQAAGAGEEAEQEQQEALDDVKQARRNLAEERQAAEEQLAQEQLDRIASQIQGLIPRQQTVLDEIRRLDALRAGNAALSRAQLKTLLKLAGMERELQEDCNRLAETLTAARVFSLALKGAGRQMQRAAGFLDEHETGGPTLTAAEAAKKRLEELIASLKPSKSGGGGAQPEGQGAGQEGGDTVPTDGIPLMAELKMLRSLQVELTERTAELEKFLDENGELTEAQKAELQDIAVEQGHIADLARNLTSSVSQEEEPMEEKE